MADRHIDPPARAAAPPARSRRPRRDNAAPPAVRGLSVAVLAVALLFADTILAADRDSDTHALDLTQSELAWIEAHPVIRIAPDPGFPPIEYFDESGEYAGIAADFMQIVEEMTGLRFEVVRCEDWDEVLIKARIRLVDALPAAAQTPERSTYLLYSEPHIVLPGVIITRARAEDPVSLEDLTRMKVSIVEGYVWQEFLEKDFPDIRLDLTPDLLTCLRKVALGLSDATVVTLPVALYYIEQQGLTNLKVAGETGYFTRLSFASRSDWPELSSIVRTALDHVPEEEKERILGHWIHVHAQSPFRRAEFLIAAAGIVVIFVIVIAAVASWNRSLRRRVHRRTEELRVQLLERQRADEERERLQAQLIQAQKMESVGRLAGGVAHDFNNMLGVIIGHSELAMEELDPSSPVYENLQQIHTASLRSTDVVRQLLAFARKQTIAPRVLDLSEAVEGMLKMLRRLIGEDIELAWLPKSGACPVRLDPTQIDQVLANLCVNARDAIDGVGKIVIETAAITVDEHAAITKPYVRPGNYVVLSVSDDGRGMDEETRRMLFEPFFTTKEPGKGTGLGLATVYGIVKQNDGFINVYSEPGIGSTFRIYFPRFEGEGEDEVFGEETPIPRGAGETVLVVEDEEAILALAERLLGSLGYRVLAARTPTEALAIAEEHRGGISLLVTDVVMPEMNGKELAGRLAESYPSLRTLYMSGYSADVIAHRGMLEKGVRFIQKPFSTADLAVAVRRALTG